MTLGEHEASSYPLGVLGPGRAERSAHAWGTGLVGRGKGKGAGGAGEVACLERWREVRLWEQRARDQRGERARSPERRACWIERWRVGQKAEEKTIAAEAGEVLRKFRGATVAGFRDCSLNTCETQGGRTRHGSPTCGFARRKGSAWVHAGRSRGRRAGPRLRDALENPASLSCPGREQHRMKGALG